MSFLSFFTGSREKKEVTEEPEIQQSVFVDNSEPIDTVSKVYEPIGRLDPIDRIFDFIKRNYEDDGYDDAMVCTDVSYKDSKMKSIKQELHNMMEQTKLKYEDLIEELTLSIAEITNQGLDSTLQKLELRQNKYTRHIKKINDMYEDLEAENPKMYLMIESYKRGYTRGLAAKTDNLLNED